MLSRKELESFRTQTGFNIWQIERDYLQHLFLLFLSRHSKKQFVFKGGTALQKVYGLNRFSIDLDFTNTANFKPDPVIESVKEDITKFGFKADRTKLKGRGAINFFIKIQGPLYDGSIRSLSKLKIEISLREDIIMKPAVKEVVPLYTDIQPYTILVMQLEEIMAEKIRATLSRNKARDLYDLWFLLKRGINFNKEITNKKLSYYNTEFNIKKFKAGIEEKKAIWDNELSLLLPRVPDFKEIKGFVFSKIE